MQKEITLTAFEDYNGTLGWGIGTLGDTFEDLDACSSGMLLAHDILEHNPESQLKGAENELEAIGAAEYVRGSLQLENDLIFISRYAMQEGISVPRGTLEEINGHMHEAAKSLVSECDPFDTEDRKNLRDYIKYASTYMQQGYDWAADHYSSVWVCRMFSEIEEKFSEPEFEGERVVLMLDFEETCVTWHDWYDLNAPEEDEGY